MTSVKEMKLLKLKRMETLIGRVRPFTPKTKKNLCRICLKDRKTMPIFWKEILQMETIHKILQKEGMILSCPKYPNTMIEMKI